MINSHPLASRHYKIVQINLMFACQFTDTIASICKVVILAPKLALRLLQINVTTFQCCTIAQTYAIGILYVFFSFLYAGFAKVRLTQRHNHEMRNRMAVNLLPFGVLLILIYLSACIWHLYLAGYVLADASKICEADPMLCNQPPTFLIIIPGYMYAFICGLAFCIISIFFGYLWVLRAFVKEANNIPLSTKTRQMMDVFERVFHFQLLVFGLLFGLPYCTNILLFFGVGENQFIFIGSWLG
ncbi:unnamed protein product, partial [Mesorhabditis spiculigera]